MSHGPNSPSDELPDQSFPGWQIYSGKRATSDIARLANFPPPPWRVFGNGRPQRGTTYRPTADQIRMVNAALYLRRPLLITGKPGVGKSSLAYSVAEALDLGHVFRWAITSRTSLNDGLYRYDAIGRMQEAELNPEASKLIEKYLTLGPLGSALAPSKTPRVLLIDEIDKSDIDLPNDLLNIFEEGEFEIPELARISDPPKHDIRLQQSDETTEVIKGKVRCDEFPFVVMTSNGERDFPAPFLRRCLRLNIEPPGKDELARIVEAHLAQHFKDSLKEEAQWRANMDNLIEEFLKLRDKGMLANDQLLNAVYLITHSQVSTKDKLVDDLLQSLGSAAAQ